MSKNLYHARTELCPDIQWPMWYKLSIEADETNFMDIPEDSELLSNNGISMVWRSISERHIYKQSTPFLTQNEWYFLHKMGMFVPIAWKHTKYTVVMSDLGISEKFSDNQVAQYWATKVLDHLQDRGIRHGDITLPNIIVKNDYPFILDWAEARLAGDSRLSKRDKSDGYWLQKTFEELCDDKE